MALPNPLSVYRTVTAAKRIIDGGGAAAVKLDGIEGPDGWVFTSVSPVIEVHAFDGRVERLRPIVPIPFLYAWAWRLAQRLGVPLVSSLAPSSLRAGTPLPRVLP
ncbi:MAG: hypothetical protein ACR2NA_03900 [Solirubrobacterales bacterium]